MNLFFIALGVAPFQDFFLFFFSSFFFFFFSLFVFCSLSLFFFFFRLFHSAFPLFSLALCRAVLISLLFYFLSFQCFVLDSFCCCFYQCPEVTLYGWWYVKIQELSLDQSTHPFLVMFFLAHHRAPFCSEYFPLPPPPFFLSFFFSFFFFSTHIVSVVLFFSAAQVFSMGLFTCSLS